MTGAAQQKIPLAEQQAKLGRLLDERVAHYRRAVDKGTRSLEWASAKQAEIEAIRASFAYLVANAGWIKSEHQRRIDQTRRDAERAAELEELKREPAVAAVLDEFPGAEIAEVRKLEEHDT